MQQAKRAILFPSPPQSPNWVDMSLDLGNKLSQTGSGLEGKDPMTLESAVDDPELSLLSSGFFQDPSL